MSVSLVKQSPGDMRHRILDAATRLFAERGFAGTSIQAVADEVGIRKPSLLYHFNSKATLREAVVESLFGRWKDVLPRVLVAATSGQNRFDATVAELMHFFGEDPSRARLLVREVLDNPDEMRRQVQIHVLPWLHMVSEYIRLGQQTGQVRPDVDSDMFPMQLVTMSLASFALLNVMPLPDNDPSGAASLQRQLDEIIRMARISLFTETTLAHSPVESTHG